MTNAPARKHDLGLRRAKTATTNSIKKLFKGRRDAPRSDADGSRLHKQGSAYNAVAHGMADEPYMLAPPIAPYAQRRPIESRPSSAHSTRSVRSIFSSARRITLRPSMLFRQKDHTDDFGSGVLEPEPGSAEQPPASQASGLPASQASPSPASQAPRSPASRAPGSPPLLQDCASLSIDADGPPTQGLSPAEQQGRHSKMPATQPAQQSTRQQRPATPSRLAQTPPRSARPLPAPVVTRHISAHTLSIPIHALPIPVQTLPSVPHTPAASYSSGTANSPTSYSSRSLGLHSLDFGYDKHVVDALMPSSPSSSPITTTMPDAAESLAPSPQSNMSPKSCCTMSPLSSRSPANATADCPANHAPTACSAAIGCYANRGEVRLSLAELDTPIELVDINSLGNDDEDGRASLVSHPHGSPQAAGASALPSSMDAGVNTLDEPLHHAYEPGIRVPDGVMLEAKQTISLGIVAATAHGFGDIYMHDLDTTPSAAEDASVSADTRSKHSPAAPQAECPAAEPASQLVVDDIDELLAELGLADPLDLGCQAFDSASAEMPDLLCPLSRGVDDDTFSLSEIDELLETLDKDTGHRAREQAAAHATPRPTSTRTSLTHISPVHGAQIVQALGNVDAIVCAASAGGVCTTPPAAISVLGSPGLPGYGGGNAMVEAAASPSLGPAEIICELGRVIDIVLPLEAPVSSAPMLDVGLLVAQLGRAEGLTTIPALLPCRQCRKLTWPSRAGLVAQLGRCPLGIPW